ncbi:MAG TPA: zinc ribbon domain-containing protein [Chloroflexota bacterium]|nr:zinc ribbon domain-containing protein [Chloroflexota bacterium]
MPVEEILATVERIVRIVLTVLAAYFVALWIATIWWTFRDIRSRTNDFLLQLAATLLVTVFSLPGLLIYFILRPPRTLAELYEESLAEEAMLQEIQVQTACPACKQHAEPDFIFCPWCQTRLKRLCTRCERPLLLRWRNCPYCGQVAVGGPVSLTPAAAPPAAPPAAEASRLPHEPEP